MTGLLLPLIFGGPFRKPMPFGRTQKRSGNSRNFSHVSAEQSRGTKSCPSSQNFRSLAHQESRNESIGSDHLSEQPVFRTIASG